jgi:hypothetical protein
MQPAVAPEPVKTTSQTRPEPLEEEVGTKYQTYAEFTRDQSRWVVEQERAAIQADFDSRIRAGIEADRAERGFFETVNKTFTTAKERYPDFEAVRANGPGAQVNFSGERLQWILSQPEAPDILYAISKDGVLAHRLATIPDMEFGVAVSRLASQSAASPVSASVGSSVPAPYSPVGSSSRTASVPLSDLPKKAGYDFDSSGYREKRARELGRKR